MYQANAMIFLSGMIGLSVVGIAAHDLLVDVHNGIAQDDVLSEIQFDAFIKLQRDFDTLAELQDMDKFNLQIDKIESLKNAQSITEASNTFDEIMEGFGTDITFENTYCHKYNDWTLEDLKDLSEQDKIFIQKCIK